MKRPGALLAALLPLILLVGCDSAPGSEARMGPCPSSPNCVSSLAEDPEKWMPALRFDIPVTEAQTAVRDVVGALPRVTLVVEDASYLRFEVRSRWLGFVDDVEFRLEPENQTIHFRSAARTGYSDLGVNRERMEEITRELARLNGIALADEGRR